MHVPGSSPTLIQDECEKKIDVDTISKLFNETELDNGPMQMTNMIDQLASINEETPQQLSIMPPPKLPASMGLPTLIPNQYFDESNLQYEFSEPINHPINVSLKAATSPASKLHEETLTYLNQGQPYEVKFEYNHDAEQLILDKKLFVVARIVFHDRRLQYHSANHWTQWSQRCTQNGEKVFSRVLSIDIPVCINVEAPKESAEPYSVTFIWDTNKDARAQFRVNVISTEFTQKGRGGEKGVPFRLHIDMYPFEKIKQMMQQKNDISPEKITNHLLTSLSCQIKVFKPKGADRKLKTDCLKIEKKTLPEKSKYQQSSKLTILQRCDPLMDSKGSVIPPPGFVKEDKIQQESPTLSYQIQRYSTSMEDIRETQVQSQIRHNSASVSDLPALAQTETEFPLMKDEQFDEIINQSATSNYGSEKAYSESSPYIANIDTSNPLQFSQVMMNFNPNQVNHWLMQNNFGQNVCEMLKTCSGPDLLRFTREDLIQILQSISISDAIRLYNCIQCKPITCQKIIYINFILPLNYNIPSEAVVFFDQSILEQAEQENSDHITKPAQIFVPVVLHQHTVEELTKNIMNILQSQISSGEPCGMGLWQTEHENASFIQLRSDIMQGVARVADLLLVQEMQDNGTFLVKLNNQYLTNQLRSDSRFYVILCVASNGLQVVLHQQNEMN